MQPREVLGLLGLIIADPLERDVRPDVEVGLAVGTPGDVPPAQDGLDADQPVFGACFTLGLRADDEGSADLCAAGARHLQNLDLG